MPAGAALILPLEIGHSRDRYQTIHASSIAALSNVALPKSIRGMNGPCFSRTHSGGANMNGWLFRPPATPNDFEAAAPIVHSLPKQQLAPLYPNRGYSKAHHLNAWKPPPPGIHRARTNTGAQYTMDVTHIPMQRLAQLTR